MNAAKEFCTELLHAAGIRINGKQPWDIQVHNQQFYTRVVRERTLGVGESYMQKWWDVEALDEFFARGFASHIHQKLKLRPITILQIIYSQLFNLQNKLRAKQVTDQHYNLDNQLYRYMLGPSMSYTCAYWHDAHDLDTAQMRKHELICRKINLTSQDTLLDLGCGWGGFAKYAASHYGCKVVAVNLSSEQIHYAKQHAQELPIQYYNCDYRDIHIYNPKQIQFDKVVSIGLCEHIGYKNYLGFIQLVHQCLKEEGLFLLHTIGSDTSVTRANQWISKYIFPNSMLPSIAQLGKVFEGHFVMEDWHNFGADYDRTLMAWYHNYQQHLDYILDKYGEVFHRMWRYYLLSCAGMFRARATQLWQIVLSKHGVRGGYVSIR
jgi:cyclopropane-fatty-acyl-phospholipid synthase